MIYETLENGVQIAIRETHAAKTVAIQCWASVGSLDERDDQRGLAHFIEHMLFKGTARRKVGEIAATVEACGGDINAYTTFDHTVFYLTLASEHAGIGIDLLADAIYNSAFDNDEFVREKEVILEEIKRSQDNPGAQIGQKAFSACYPEHEAGRPIIGFAEQVSAYTRDQLFDFYKYWYKPNNLTVVIVGDVHPENILKLVEKEFGRTKAGPIERRESQVRKFPDGIHTSIIRGDYTQPRVEIVFPAPDLEHFDTAALDVAAFALGSGELSRFHRTLRDEKCLLTAASASVFSPSFPGLFEISAVLPEETLLPAIQGLIQETVGLRGGVTDQELQRARANLTADKVYRDETVDGLARQLGLSLRTRHKLLFDDVYSVQIERMPASNVVRAARHWLNPERCVVVALVPEDSTLSEPALAAAVRQGASAAIPSAGSVPIGERSTAEEPEIELLELKPGIKFIYRRNVDAQMFSCTVATEGGQRGEQSIDGDLPPGFFHALSGMLGLASSKTDYESLMHQIEGRGASLEGFSGKDSFGFALQCLPDDTERLVARFGECILTPHFPGQQFQNIRREISHMLNAQNDSPASLCMRRFQKEVFGDHPYSLPMYGVEASLARFSEIFLAEGFARFRDEGPWVAACTGPQSVDHIRGIFERALADFAPTTSPRTFASDGLIHTPSAREVKIDKDREQTHIVIGFPGTTWNDELRPALDVLVNVLGGNGGRLFVNLRDRLSLAYTVTPVVMYGRHPGTVGAYIACAPEKTEVAIAELKREMAEARERAAEPLEIERARNYIIGSHAMNLQRSDSQVSTMALMELYGFGFDDFIRYPQAIARVESSHVQRAAQKFLRQDQEVTVVVGPESSRQSVQKAT